MRVLPLENEALNQCWLSDKDRFSYEALNLPERLAKPMIRKDGALRETDWQTAIEFAAVRLGEIAKRDGGAAIGCLGTPHATLEELHLLARLARGLGSDNVDFRLRHSDFSADPFRQGAPWLGMKVAEIGTLDRVLVVGSFLRKDHPLLATRFRLAAQRGQHLNLIHAADDELLMRVANKAIVRPGDFALVLGQVVKAVAEAKGAAVPAPLAALVVSSEARAIAASLATGKNVGLFLGNAAEQHPRAGQLALLVQTLADLLGARWGVLGAAANSVGGYLAGAVPGKGLAAAAMLASPRKAYVILAADPELDSHDARRARAAMEAAEFVVSLAMYETQGADYADVMLPIGPFTETSGTFVNTEGAMQSFSGVVQPLGDARPAWKVLRVLGTTLGLAGFDFDSSEQVRDAVGDQAWVDGQLSNRVEGLALAAPAAASAGIERIADVPVYFADPIVRRAPSLQQTADARPPQAYMHSQLLARLGIEPGQAVRVRQEAGEALLAAARDDGLPDGAVRVAAGHASTARLGGMFGAATVEKA
jgi:NADH-quinone oxidoreductase subunit G